MKAKLFAFVASLFLAGQAGAFSQTRICVFGNGIQVQNNCSAVPSVIANPGESFTLQVQSSTGNTPAQSALWGSHISSTPAQNIPSGCRATLNMIVPQTNFTLTGWSAPWDQVNAEDNPEIRTMLIYSSNLLQLSTFRNFNITVPGNTPSAFRWVFGTGFNGYLQRPVAPSAGVFYNWIDTTWQAGSTFGNYGLVVTAATVGGAGWASQISQGCLDTNSNIQVTSQILVSIRPDCPDLDEDFVCDAVDNCPQIFNTNQANFDGQGRGDACLCGDGNGDAMVDVADIIATNICIFNPATCTHLMDANNNGTYNVADLVAINQEIFSPTETATCRFPNGDPIQTCPDTEVSCQ